MFVSARFKGKLQMPGLNILGVIGIFIGLAFVVYDNRKQEQEARTKYLQVQSVVSDEKGKSEVHVVESLGPPDFDAEEDDELALGPRASEL